MCLVVVVIKIEMDSLIVFIELGNFVVKLGFIIIMNDIIKMGCL